MTDNSTEAAADDFAAGWLLAWKTCLAAGAAPPDLAGLDLPPGIADRLRNGTDCLRRLQDLWPAQPAPVADAPPSRVGRFELRRELGRGGFGVVYLAHDPLLGRDVAVKVPRPGAGLDPRAGQRLALEAQAAARLAHPGIVPVYESGTAAGAPYIVSAYCPGIPLSDWLQRTTGPVPWRDAARLVAALARAVDHAHARGVLHRDLKPANVLLTAPDGSPADDLPLAAYAVRIADFGMAKFLLEPPGPTTASGVILGTPAYMAPEQAGGRARDVTTAVDVYALGAVLYELVTRRPPFAGDTPLGTLDKVRTEPPAPPRSGRADLPADLETLCLKCLEKDPANRYPSAAALADDLDRVLRGEPVLARRATALERLARAARRHPAVAGLSALLAASLVGGLVATTAMLRQARAERDRAERHLQQVLDVSDETAIAAANDAALRAPEFGPLRDRLLSDAEGRLVRLAAELGDDPAKGPLLARCHLRLGRLQFALGKKAEARASAARAVEGYERLVRDDPGDATARTGLALALMARAYPEDEGPGKRELVERARAAHEQAPRARFPAGHDPDIVLAEFLFDMAVAAAAGGDPDAARGYLAASCDRLRPLRAAGSPVRREAVRALGLGLQFRCQLDRQCKRHRDAVEAGADALAVAREACREWPGEHRSWDALGVACNEYGLALEAAGRAGEAFAVWREGYDRLGGDDARKSAGAIPSAAVGMTHIRLMIAYNLGKGYANRDEAGESARWFRNGLELARWLSVVMPDHPAVLYLHGMCCANLIGVAPAGSIPPAGLLALHREGLASLEKSLRLSPHDHSLRSDLGVCWHRYAADRAAASEYIGALAAVGRAIVHQLTVVTASPGTSDCRNRLRSHLAQLGELVAHPPTRARPPARLPPAAD